EVERVRVLDARYDEGAGAVILLDVDGQAEVDVVRFGDGGLALGLDERPVHHREVRHRLDQCVADQVGERHLAATTATQVVVDHDAVVDEQLRRYRPHARRGRDGETRLHVGDDASSRPP